MHVKLLIFTVKPAAPGTPGQLSAYTDGYVGLWSIYSNLGADLGA